MSHAPHFGHVQRSPYAHLPDLAALAGERDRRFAQFDGNRCARAAIGFCRVMLRSPRGRATASYDGRGGAGGDSSSRGTSAPQDASLVRRLRHRAREPGLPARLARLLGRRPRRLGAALLWGISAIVAVFINTLYSELAAMFPEKSGGLALYAHEAWRKYTTLIGPIATFGYWIGWSVVLRSTASSSARSSRAPGSRASRIGGASNPGRHRLLLDGHGARSACRSSSRSASSSPSGCSTSSASASA